MQKTILFFLLLISFYIGYRYFFSNNNDIHKNPKYNFSFTIPQSYSLENRGRITTCGRNNCAEFSGPSYFQYSVEKREAAHLSGGAMISGTKISPYEYFYKNGKIFRDFAILTKSPQDGGLQYEFTKSEATTEEPTPYYTNPHGISFYNEGGKQYCTFKYFDEKDVTVVCFQTENYFATDSSTGIRKSTSEIGPLFGVFQTFKFNN